MYQGENISLFDFVDDHNFIARTVSDPLSFLFELSFFVSWFSLVNCNLSLSHTHLLSLSLSHTHTHSLSVAFCSWLADVWNGRIAPSIEAALEREGLEHLSDKVLLVLVQLAFLPGCPLPLEGNTCLTNSNANQQFLYVNQNLSFLTNFYSSILTN